jgi:RND family efflux transporter MFP subunit
MKKVLSISFFLAALLAMLFTAACKRENAVIDPDVAYYTCTMHPSVRMQDPKAKCPICGMSLVPVRKSALTNAPSTNEQKHASSENPPAQQHTAPQTPIAGEEKPSEFFVPLDRQQMIGVTYAKVEKRPLRQTIRAVGTVTYDKQRYWNFVSRVEGYVQKLEIFSRGENVEAGQPLLTLYSPDLLTTQQELLNALRLRDEATKAANNVLLENANRRLESVKRRLNLWNINEKQLDEIEKNGKASDTLTLYSPFKGVVQNLQVDQGRRVMPGDHLIDVVDLSVVWVWADFYENELPLLKKDLPVLLVSSAYPNEKFEGKIALIDPFLDEIKRTARVRIDLQNPNLKLRPEMYVDVQTAIDLGEGLVVPVSAVLPTGKGNLVFVDKGEGKLEPRFVSLGRKFADAFAVEAGLSEGERVVASANFLIDAESKVQGALKSF